MPSQEDPLIEARRMATLLVGAAEHVKGAFAEAVALYGLPVTTARALLLLQAPAPMRDLATHMSCDQSYITLIADDLEQRGLVTREPGTDRRVKVLTLTEAGITTRDQISLAVAERSPIMARLTPAERATLDRLLTALVGGGCEH